MFAPFCIVVTISIAIATSISTANKANAAKVSVFTPVIPSLTVVSTPKLLVGLVVVDAASLAVTYQVYVSSSSSSSHKYVTVPCPPVIISVVNTESSDASYIITVILSAFVSFTVVLSVKEISLTVVWSIS